MLRRLNVVGAPDTIRTCGLHLRRVALYPAELRVQHYCLRSAYAEFLASVKRSTPISQVSGFIVLFRSPFLHEIG
jgi:hypothetical protein